MKSFRLHRGHRQAPDPEDEATLLIRLIGTFAVIAFVIGLASGTGIVLRQQTWWGIAVMTGAIGSLYICWRIALVRRQIRERRRKEGASGERSR